VEYDELGVLREGDEGKGREGKGGGEGIMKCFCIYSEMNDDV
jgi:hypothetical protein